MDIFTVAQVAGRMALSKELIAKYCREGRFSKAALKGRMWLIPADAVAEFEKAHREYGPGRPRKIDSRWVMWRERGRKAQAVSRAAAFATRAPAFLPERVSQRAAMAYASLGRTIAERSARKAMMDALYDRQDKGNPADAREGGERDAR